MNRGNYCSDSSFCFWSSVVPQLVEIFHLLLRGCRAESDLLLGILKFRIYRAKRTAGNHERARALRISCRKLHRNRASRLGADYVGRLDAHRVEKFATAFA